MNARIWCLLLGLLGTTAPAFGITYYAQYPLGEPGTVGALNRPIDVSGNGHNFVNEQNAASITTTNSVAAPFSTTALVFPSSPVTGYYTTNGAPSVQDNFDFDLWANASSVNQGSGDLFVSNSATAGSLRLGITNDGLGGSNWVAHYAGVSWIGAPVGAGQPVTANTWTHLRVRAQNGTSSLYINGVKQPGTVPTPVMNWGGMHLGVSPGGSEGFEGALDELSITQNNLVTNGGFESGDLTGFTVLPGSALLVYQNSNGEYCCGLGGAVPQGTFAAAIGGGGTTGASFGQVINTSPGSRHVGSLLLANVGEVGAPLDVAVFDALTFDFNNPLSNTPFATFSFNAASGGVFESKEFSFVPPSASTVLAFQAASSAGSGDLLLDSIVVIPEPTTAMLLGCGLVGLFAARRRARG